MILMLLALTHFESSTVHSFLRRLYRTSLADAARMLRAKLATIETQAASAPAHITERFLRSKEYAELMARHLPFDGSYDLHEAQNLTRNFRFRHFECRERLGVFRWRGIQQHLDLILESVGRGAPDANYRSADPKGRPCQQNRKLVVDFGGAASPLGLGSVVVDLAQRDIRGCPVPYRGLHELERPADVIFSSHCLEHIPALEETLELMASSLAEGGLLILHLPAFSCERWRAGEHRSRAHRDHAWTFALAGTCVPAGLPGLVYIDELLTKQLSLRVAEYCGDDSIFVLAERPGLSTRSANT